MSGSAFRYAYRVIYADCAPGNHVYYGRYLDILEAARGEFFRHYGATLLQWQEQDILFPVVECRLRYRLAARYDDLLAIEIRLAAVHGVRMNFEYRVLNSSGDLVLEGETYHVCTGLDGKPKRLPQPLLSWTSAFQTEVAKGKASA